MEESEKAKLAQHVEDQIHQLEQTIAELADKTQPVKPDSALGRISRMDAIQNKSMNEANLVMSEKRLAALKATLKTIDEDDFGLCKLCDKTIPFARLMLMPETTLCVTCAEKQTPEG